jgi:hypothetical protein
MVGVWIGRFTALGDYQLLLKSVSFSSRRMTPQSLDYRRLHMARVACRWPGGINLHIKKTGLPTNRWPQFQLMGPAPGPNVPDVMKNANRALRSPAAAQLLRKAHQDHIKHMAATRDHPLHQMQYVENNVPDSFWHAWLAQHGHTDTHVHKLVFEIK